MKHWAGLLLVFVVAAIAAVVIAPRFRPSALERRHATIRVGMTSGEVENIMDQAGVNHEKAVVSVPKGGPPFRGEVWLWPCRRDTLRGEVKVVVVFDQAGRVTETATSYEWP